MSMTIMKLKPSPQIGSSDSTSELYRRNVSNNNKSLKSIVSPQNTQQNSCSRRPQLQVQNVKFIPDKKKSDEDFFNQVATFKQERPSEGASLRESSSETENTDYDDLKSYKVDQNGDGNSELLNTHSVRSLPELKTSSIESYPLLKQRLGHVWENKYFTDVVFKVGPSEDIVEAHRMILASGSKVLQELLYDSKPLIVDEKLLLHEPEYSLEAFETFIKGFYTNEIPINLNLPTVLEVFYATKKYKVGFLQEQVLNHLRNSITISNVFEILRMSTNMLELTFLAPVCWQVIEEQTEDVLQYHLGNLDTRTFARILERDHLNLDEVKIFQFLVRWGAVQCKNKEMKTTGKNKRQFIESLLKHIRFPTMNIMDFNDIIVPTRTLETKEIQAILTYINKTDPKISVPYKTSPRIYFPTVELGKMNQSSEDEEDSSALVTAKSDVVLGNTTTESQRGNLKRSNLSKFRSKRGSGGISTPRS